MVNSVDGDGLFEKCIVKEVKKIKVKIAQRKNDLKNAMHQSVDAAKVSEKSLAWNQRGKKGFGLSNY